MPDERPDKKIESSMSMGRVVRDEVLMGIESSAPSDEPFVLVTSRSRARVHPQHDVGAPREERSDESYRDFSDVSDYVFWKDDRARVYQHHRVQEHVVKCHAKKPKKHKLNARWAAVRMMSSRQAIEAELVKSGVEENPGPDCVVSGVYFDNSLGEHEFTAYFRGVEGEPFFNEYGQLARFIFGMDDDEGNEHFILFARFRHPMTRMRLTAWLVVGRRMSEPFRYRFVTLMNLIDPTVLTRMGATTPDLLWEMDHPVGFVAFPPDTFGYEFASWGGPPSVRSHRAFAHDEGWQGNTVDALIRSRGCGRLEIVLDLLRSGVEPNPGPGKKYYAAARRAASISPSGSQVAGTSASHAVKVQQAEEKTGNLVRQKGRSGKTIDKIHQSTLLALDEEQAAEDIKNDKIASAAAAKLDRAAADRAAHELAEKLQYQKKVDVFVSRLPILHGFYLRSAGAGKHEAVVREEDLAPCAESFVVHDLLLKSVERIEVDMRLKYHSDLRLSGKFGTMLRFDVTRKQYMLGFFRDSCVSEVVINLEFLLLLQKMCLSSREPNFDVVYSRVESMYSHFTNLFYDPLDAANFDQTFVVSVYAGILCLSGAGHVAPGWLEVLSGQYEEKLYRLFFKYLSRDKRVAKGSYVQGYHLSYSDVLPKEVKLQEKGGIVFSDAPLKDAAHMVRRLPFGFTDLPATFPAHDDDRNVLFGASKRLLLEPLHSEPAFTQLYQRFADYLISIVTPVEPTPEEIEFAVNEHFAKGGGAQYTESDRVEFREGVRCVIAALRLQDDGANAIKLFGDVKCMLKKEFYPASVLKGVRFIVIPSMRMRGASFAIFHSIEKALIASPFGQMLVKGLNPKEIREKLLSRVEQDFVWSETDFTSMESNIRGVFLHTEERIFASIARGVIARLVAAVYDSFYGEGFSAGGDGVICDVKNKFFCLLFAAMRFSGQYFTSIGNAVANFCFLGTILAWLMYGEDALSKDVSTMVAELHLFECCLVEGDDGVFVIPTRVVTELGLSATKTKLDALAARLGVRLKMDLVEVDHLHFCGNILAGERGAEQLLRDPLEVLRHATHAFDVNYSNACDLDLLVSRALSNAILLGNLPVVSAWNKGILDRFSDRIAGLRERLQRVVDGESTPPAWMIDMLNKFHGNFSCIFAILGFDPRGIVVSDDVRVAVEERYGLSIAEQLRMEEIISSGIAQGLEDLTLGREWTHAEERVCVQHWPGSREIARECAKHAVIDEAVSEALLWVPACLITGLYCWLFFMLSGFSWMVWCPMLVVGLVEGSVLWVCSVRFGLLHSLGLKWLLLMLVRTIWVSWTCWQFSRYASRPLRALPRLLREVGYVRSARWVAVLTAALTFTWFCWIGSWWRIALLSVPRLLYWIWMM
jgi:hypothetical protein